MPDTEINALTPVDVAALGDKFHGNDVSNSNLSRMYTLQQIYDLIRSTSAVTANKALISDGSGNPVASTVSSTELAFLVGLTSLAQGQFDKIKRIEKTADESISSDSTLSDDSELVIALNANKFHMGFYMGYGNSGVTPDFKYAFTVPANSTHQRLNGAINASASTVALLTTSLTLSTAGDFGFFSIFFIETVDAGNLRLQWAQNVLDASTTTLKKGSWMAVIEI